MPDAIRQTGWMPGARRCATGAMLALLLTVRRGGAPQEPRLIRLTATTTMPGDAGCASYSEARLARPSPETVAEVPGDWADWIADLDDRMTGTCR